MSNIKILKCPKCGQLLQDGDYWCPNSCGTVSRRSLNNEDDEIKYIVNKQQSNTLTEDEDGE